MKVMKAMKRVALLTAVLLLSGCGIPATGVIQSGDPATGVRPPNPLLYFVTTDHRLVPVSREVTDPVGVRTALDLLLNGPDLGERLLGLTTALARIPTPEVSMNGAEVTLQMSAGTEPLPPIAARQLICTAAAARLTQAPDTAATGVTVVVTGPDGQHTEGASRTCSIPRPAAPPAETPGISPGG
ncbi:hypothetical protein EDD90_2090 [Streptomyces sp. Ag109_O5-1]|uniref:GerMN domain-containing protein n=1 Tax=Streptomyces sp. Ag109_O5-1 TaxID=1938851 RepID=UPI000F50BAD5|nr:GerMN domain-containing protein [Streptomyces sp. Ag109_O5-1]RPE39126.1 hypothetical protein EDD90_2090 [Streptomyces sp. Ag109_O5-1]